MARGEPTSEAVIAEFRALYLLSGNASATARELKIAERTGRTIAAQLDGDETFAEEGRKLYARALQRNVAMRVRMAEKADERFHAEWTPEPGERDPRPDYGRLILESEKNAQNLSRFEAELGGQVAPDREITIRVEPMKPAGSGEKP